MKLVTELENLEDKDANGGKGQNQEDREMGDSIRLLLTKNSAKIRERLLNMRPVKLHVLPVESCRMHAN